MSICNLAARFGRRFELRHYRDDLIHAGHTVTSRWLDLAEENNAPDAQRECAVIDLADVGAADTLIAFTEPSRSVFSRGGRHVELGYAIGLGKRVIICGWRENIFCHLPAAEFYPTWPEALGALQ